MERGRERWEGIEGWKLWSSGGGLVHFSGAGERRAGGLRWAVRPRQIRRPLMVETRRSCGEESSLEESGLLAT
jgi:hypothetical protein